MRILDWNFTDSLMDPMSADFMEREAQVCQQVVFLYDSRIVTAGAEQLTALNISRKATDTKIW